MIDDREIASLPCQGQVMHGGGAVLPLPLAKGTDHQGQAVAPQCLCTFGQAVQTGIIACMNDSAQGEVAKNETHN